jgi:ATPase subunit of ABC transporter with duplicated ATPase domains
MLSELLSLSASNRVVVIEGPNGSGKSTLLDGVQKELFGSGLRFGVLSQHESVFEELCANELCAALGSSKASSLVEEFGLAGPVLSRPLYSLSSGEKTKVLLSLALSAEGLVLLDEPFAHLDAAAKDQLESLIRESDSKFVIANHDSERLSEFPRLKLQPRS